MSASQFSDPALQPTRHRAVALLVDGDNIAARFATEIKQLSIALMGHVAVQRVYGDVGKLGDWLGAPGHEILHAHAGKNVTDQMLTVQAMELSFGGVIDGFVLVSADLEYAPLARSLRARGFRVLGIGPYSKADGHFQNAMSSYVALQKAVEPPPTVIEEPSRLAKPLAMSVAPKPQPVPVAKPPGAVRSPVAAASIDVRLLGLPAGLPVAIRTALAHGPVPAVEFGKQMGSAGYSIPKGYARWRSVFSRHPELKVRATGAGPESRSLH